MSKFGADGSLPQETIDELKARVKVVETPAATPAKAAPATPTPKTPATPKTAVAKTNGAAAATSPAKPATAATPKRKPEAEAASAASGGEKKAKLSDPNELRIYVEPEIMHNNKVSGH